MGGDTPRYGAQTPHVFFNYYAGSRLVCTYLEGTQGFGPGGGSIHLDRLCLNAKSVRVAMGQREAYFQHLSK